MKKFKNVISLIVCFIAVLTVTGCKDKKSITADEFKNTMESNDYIVQEATDQFSEYDYVKKVYIALSSDSSYQIEFYQLSDEDYATSFYNNNKSIFEKSKSSKNSETSVSMSNYSKYTLQTNGKYKVISRIGNTAIYLNVDTEYKADVKSILKELGY